MEEDTVSEDDKNDEVETVEHGSSGAESALRSNSVVHHEVPIFARQYLHSNARTFRPR